MEMKERILYVRTKVACMSQSKFAESIGLARGSIAKYELGDRTPYDSVLRVIASTYRVNLEWLKTGEGEPVMKTSEEEELLKAVQNYYRLSDTSMVIIKAWCNMNPEQREVLENLIKNLSK